MLFYFLIVTFLIPIIAQKNGEEGSINLQKPIDLNIPDRAEMKEREQRFSSRRGSPFIDDRRSRVMDIDLERDRHEYNDRSRRMEFERNQQKEFDRKLERQREIERDQQIEMERRREIEKDRVIELERRREIERDREIELQRRREIEIQEELKRQEEQGIEAELEQRRQKEQHEEINREVNKALQKREDLKRLTNTKTGLLSTRPINANRGETGGRQANLDSNRRQDIQRDVRHIDPRGDRNRVEEIARERETARIQAERNQEKRERARKLKYNNKQPIDVDTDQDIEESRRGESRVIFNDRVSNRDGIKERYSITGDRKAPILILEQVEVPVPVPVTALGGGLRPILPGPGVDTRRPDPGDRHIWYGSGPGDLDRRPARHPYQSGVPLGPGSFPVDYGPIPVDPLFPPFNPTLGPDEFHVHTYEEGAIRDPKFIGPRLPPPQIAGHLQLQKLAIQNQVGQAIQNQVGQALLVDHALKHQAAGVQQAAAAEATVTKLHAVKALKNALKTKIKEKLKHNLEVASVVAGQNAIRKQHATDLAVALHHVPQNPTNLALHIAEVKHHYDKTRKELLRRLILLKPYFLRSGSLEYSMPSSLPKLPNGILNLTPLQVQQLPLVPIQGPLTLVGPPIHLPNSLRGTLGPTVDEKYIEFILKLPDNIFRVITHMTKREFLVTLFPRLYHESVDAINHEKNKIYGPPKPTSLYPITTEHYAPVTIPPYTESPITNPPYKHPESSYVTPEPSYSHNHNRKPIKFPAPSSSYGPPPPPSPTYGIPHAPSPTYGIPHAPSPTNKDTNPHVSTVHHEHIHHHHQVPAPSIINGGGHSQKPNIYTTPQSIILPISDHHGNTPMPLYPPNGFDSQPRHQVLPSVLQVTTPVPHGEHHTTTILQHGSNVPAVTTPSSTVVGHGVHIRPQGHPLTDHPSAVIPVTQPPVIHITPTRLPLSPIAPLIPSPPDNYVPPIVTTQATVTTTYQPVITTTNPPISTVYNPVITTTHSPSISTVYNPVITTTHNPPIPTVYNPVITTTHNPPIPTVYNPVITTTHNPPIPTVYNPVITTTHNPPITTPYDPITTSYIPVGTTPNNPFIPISNTPSAPVTTTYQPPIFTTTAAPPVITTIQPIVTTFFEEFPDASDIPDFFRPVEEIPIGPNVHFQELELDDFEIDRKRPLGTDSHDDSHRFPLFVKRQGDGSSKEQTHSFRVLNFSQQNGQRPSDRRTPMPKKIGPNGLPFSPLSHRRIPGVVPQNPPRPRPITEADLARLPAYLRKAPACASIPTNRSFCLMPDEYPIEAANLIAQKYDRELRELKSLLQHLPPIEFDLKKAAEQFPSIDKSIKCESEEKTVVLSWSRDVLGSWFAIFQTPPLQQPVTVTTCSATAKSLGCRPLLRPRPLVAFHPRDKEPRPLVFEFPMPIACVGVTSDLKSAASASSVTVVVDPEQLPTTFTPSTDLSLNGRLGITTTRPMLNEKIIDFVSQPSFQPSNIQHSTSRSSHSLGNEKSIDFVSQPSFQPSNIQHSTSRPLHSLGNTTDITIITFNIPLNSHPSARQPKSLPDIVQDNLHIDSIQTATDEDKGEVIDLPPSSNETEGEASDSISGANILFINHYPIILILLFIYNVR